MKYVVIDVETTKVPRHLPWIEGSKLVSLHLKTKDKPPRAWLFNHPENTMSFARCVEEIQAELDDAEILVNQALKFDVHWFTFLGLHVEQMRHYCTQTAEYLIQAQKLKMPSLKILCEIYGISGKLDKVKELWDAGYETDEIAAEILIPYGNQDVIATEQVYLAQRTRIKDLHLETLVRIQMAAGKMYGRAERSGLKLNCELLAQHSKTYGQALARIDQQLNTIAKYQIENWASPDQKSCFFYGGVYPVKILIKDYLEFSPEQIELFQVEKTGRVWVHGLKIVKGLGFTPPPGSEAAKPGFYSTGAGVLAGLTCRTREQRKTLKLIAERNRKSKIKSTYLDGLQEKVQEDGLCHPTYNQSIAITGRGTSSNPNGQNLPRDKTGPVKVAVETRFV